MNDKVLMACPTWSGCKYSLKAWAEAYHSQTYPKELRGALQVDNSDGPASGGNMHYTHMIRGYDIPAMWQHTRWPALWDTLELSWRMIVEYAHDNGYDFIFSVEADVIVPEDAMEKMVACAYENAKDGKPAVVTQRYHPRGQPGPNFYWDTLGCSLFPVEPLYKERNMVKAIFEIDVFIECERYGHPRYRPGHHGPDLFDVNHMKDPEDDHKYIFGAVPAPSAYMKRVMEANGIEPVWVEAKQTEDEIKEAAAAMQLTDEQAERLEAPEGVAPSDAIVKRAMGSGDFVKLLRHMAPGNNPEIPIGEAHLEPEVPPSGANVNQPYEGMRAYDPPRMSELKCDTPDERAKKIMESDVIRLNIGADRTQIAGFLSVDINPDVHPDVVADGLDLPFEDDSVDEVYASHVLEHFSWEDGLKALKEWKRVLKPGGLMTVASPDLTQVYVMYKHGATWGDYNQQVGAIYVQAVAFGANLLAEEIPEMKDQYGGPGHKHQSIYIHDMLLNRVIEAGFVRCHEVTQCFLRHSSIGETMVQAVKPLPEMG